MKIAAVVILYHPEEGAIHNINSYYDKVDKIYVFDNTEQGSILKERLLLQSKISYYHNAKNEGISNRLNAAANMAVNDGFEWLLLMDQDSGFSAAMIQQYITCFNQYALKEVTAMFGVNFEKQQSLADSETCHAVFSNELITSGTLLNLSLYKMIGQFDENLFIDFVDHEYTIRTLQAGYQIIQFPHIQLNHQIGTLVRRASVKTLFLVKKEKKIHSALRCYYVYRNNLYLQQKYSGTEVFSMQKLQKMAKSIIQTSFYYGKNTLQLLRYIYLAKRDFRNGKMGKLSE